MMASLGFAENVCHVSSYANPDVILECGNGIITEVNHVGVRPSDDLEEYCLSNAVTDKC